MNECIDVIVKYFKEIPDIQSNYYDLYIKSKYIYYKCQFNVLINSDSIFISITSQQRFKEILDNIQKLTQMLLELPTEELEKRYWHIYNISLLITDIFTNIIKRNDQSIPIDNIDYLNYCITAMESVITLYSVKYLETRVNLYYLAYKIYLLNNKFNESKRCAFRCVKQIDHVRNLESIQPPLPPQTIEILNSCDLLASYMFLKSEILLGNNVIDDALETYNDDYEKIQALTFVLTPVVDDYATLSESTELLGIVKDKLNEITEKYLKVYSQNWKKEEEIEIKEEERPNTKQSKKSIKVNKCILIYYIHSYKEINKKRSRRTT